MALHSSWPARSSHRNNTEDPFFLAIVSLSEPKGSRQSLQNPPHPACSSNSAEAHWELCHWQEGVGLAPATSLVVKLWQHPPPVLLKPSEGSQ